MASVHLVEPTTVEEALQSLQAHGARPLAGGTALVPLLTQRLHDFTTLVSLRRIRQLEGIRQEDGELRIGAMAPLWELAASSDVRAAAPALAQAVRHVGNVRIRNMATLGGNLCYANPHCDPPLGLLVHKARVVLQGPGGQRTLPLDVFFRGSYETALEPGELLVEVRVPRTIPGARTAYVRYTIGSEEDWPCVAVCAIARVDGGSFHGLRVGLSGAGGRSLLVKELDSVIPIFASADVGALAAAQAEAVGDLRGSTWYKREMIRVHTRRALEELAATRETA